jgi:hypothetical protein
MDNIDVGGAREVSGTSTSAAVAGGGVIIAMAIIIGTGADGCTEFVDLPSRACMA